MPASSSWSHSAAPASDGMRQSPRGDRLTEPTLGPSGKQDLLNWLAKKRCQEYSQPMSNLVGSIGLVEGAWSARNRIFFGDAP